MIWRRRKTVWRMRQGSAALAVIVLMTSAVNYLVEPSKNHRQLDVAVRSKSKGGENLREKRSSKPRPLKLNWGS